MIENEPERIILKIRRQLKSQMNRFSDQELFQILKSWEDLKSFHNIAYEELLKRHSNDINLLKKVIIIGGWEIKEPAAKLYLETNPSAEDIFELVKKTEMESLFTALLKKKPETKMLLELFALSDGQFELRKKVVKLLLTRKLSLEGLRHILFGVKEYQPELVDQIICRIISQPEVSFELLYDIIYYFHNPKEKEKIIAKILEMTDNERDLKRIESQIKKWKSQPWDDLPCGKEIEKKRNQLKQKKSQQLKKERVGGKIVPAAEIIELFLKHPDHNPSRPFIYTPDVEQKELVEFLLGDTLLSDAENKYHGVPEEYEPTVKICLAGLQEEKQLKELFADILPELNKIKEKVTAVAENLPLEEWEKVRDEILRFKEQIIESLAKEHQNQTVKIFPFSPDKQLKLRKKILLATLKLSKNNLIHQKLTEIVRKEEREE